MLLDFKEFFKRCIKALNDSKVDYVIVGGVLVSLYGEPRATKDINAIIDLDLDDDVILRFLNSLKKFDLVVVGGKETVKEALKEKIHFSAFNSSYLYWMDIQGIYSILDEIAFETRRKIEILGEETWVESMEALIVSKLSMYYSEQSLRDVESIILLNRGKLNLKLLLSIADKIGVRRRVEEILSRI